MQIKCYYNRNVKMSPEKLSAQVGHVVAHFSAKTQTVPERIIVLKASGTKFEEFSQRRGCYVQIDLGLTEIEADTPTVVGWMENSK